MTSIENQMSDSENADVTAVSKETIEFFGFFVFLDESGNPVTPQEKMMQTSTKEFILNVIFMIRNSHLDMAWLYTNGQCYNFHLILRTIFGSEVEAWYDPIKGHVYSKIGELWYDITGVHETLSPEAGLLDYLMSSDHPKNWGLRDTRRLVDLAPRLDGGAKDLGTDPVLIDKIKGGVPVGTIHTVTVSRGLPLWRRQTNLLLEDVLKEHSVSKITTTQTPTVNLQPRPQPLNKTPIGGQYRKFKEYCRCDPANSPDPTLCCGCALGQCEKGLIF